MGTWSLHIVGQELEDFVHQIGNDIVKLIEARGHTLISAQLGTDSGTTALDTTPPEVPPTPEVPVDTPPDAVPTEDTQAAVVPGDSPSESAPTA